MMFRKRDYPVSFYGSIKI